MVATFAFECMDIRIVVNHIYFMIFQKCVLLHNTNFMQIFELSRSVVFNSFLKISQVREKQLITQKYFLPHF